MLVMEKTEQTLRVIKEKDSYKYGVEIKENSKGEPAITVSVHTDDFLGDAIDEALIKYRQMKAELGRDSQ